MSVHFTEYDNPPLIIVRDGRLIELDKTKIPLRRRKKNTGPNDEALLYSTYDARPGDRIVFFSDGVTQAGIGTEHYGAGWGIERVRGFTLFELRRRPTIGARNLAESLVQTASQTDGDKPHDDISCGVVYFREPRDLLVVTGPPFREEDDREVARIFAAFHGPKVILGGTTAKIIARELGATLRASTDYTESPAVSLMDGADLVCEGALTLGATAASLAGNTIPWQTARSPDGFCRAASRFITYLLDSDRVMFIVGNKLNEAHFDPTMPVEIESRRSLIKRIAVILEEKYMKQTVIRYV
jgi:hypothetical protein